MRKTNTPTLKLWTLFLVTLVFLLVHDAPGVGAAEAPGLIDGARKETSLMIYSLLAVPDHSRIVNRFKEKYPFIEVSLIRPGPAKESPHGLSPKYAQASIWLTSSVSVVSTCFT